MISLKASKHNTGKNTSIPNQSPSREVKESISKKHLDFPTFVFSGRYSPQIPSQSTPDPIYTSSPNTPDPHQDSSSNKELRGVTPEVPLYCIHNNKVDQIHHHTQAYLKSICQIPIIYQIPKSSVSHRRTQLFGEDKTLT